MTRTKTKHILSALLLPGLLGAVDWTDYRGPKRDGSSPEKNLPSSWSPKGENLAWKVDIGGRSAPVIHGNRLYMLTTAGKGPTLQERLVCLNSDTGQLVWDYKMNLFHSDVPPHRAAWSAPAVDPETGNIYVYGVHGTLTAINRAGKLVWIKSMVEEHGLVTTHGGRTVSPVIHNDIVIVSGVSTGWGDQARAAHRFFAFDKKTGEIQYVSTPGGRPFDTTFSPPVIAEVKGTRLLIAGGGDGTVHAVKVLTGEPVWKFVMSKRGVNTGALVYNDQVIVSHSEENLDTSEMGLLASFNAAAKGDITAKDIKWKIPGFQGAFSSPILDGDRLLQIDASANLYSFDFHTGRQLWKQNLGTIQKATPVYADGKLYVGTENGKFFIIRPRNDKAEILSEVELGAGGEEQIIASAAVSRGRIYFISTKAIYAIGKKGVMPNPPAFIPETRPALTIEAVPTHVQIIPAEIIARPGQTVQFKARVYDEMGRLIREGGANWTLEGVKGTMSRMGAFTVDTANAPQAGIIKGSTDGLIGSARIRVIPPLPYSENFDTLAPKTVPRHWINTTGKYEAREIEGKKVLVKLADNAFTKRARSFVGPASMKDYTVECDAFATEKRRQMGDAGVVAQRYQLVLFGNHQRLELQSWQPETERTVQVEFPWKKDTWYHLKLMVENLPDGKVRARGKAWPTGEPEPAKWLLEKVDPQGNHQGAPGIYADAPFEVYFDNLKVTPNAGTKPAAK
ncbi:MAG: PQQ-binding-like beta-propeller repeat protein [Acidobacteria bacterium]|nr:PQQ-binding-like beta-propeller repeat protein [Acidobacteriota bacterium]